MPTLSPLPTTTNQRTTTMNSLQTKHDSTAGEEDQEEKDTINTVNAVFYNEADAIRSMERDHETAYFVHTDATHPSAAVLKVKLTTRSFEIFKDAAEDYGKGPVRRTAVERPVSPKKIAATTRN